MCHQDYMSSSSTSSSTTSSWSTSPPLSLNDVKKPVIAAVLQPMQPFEQQFYDVLSEEKSNVSCVIFKTRMMMMITLLAEGENMKIFASPASRCEEVEVSKDPTHVAAAVYHQSSITTINRYFYYNETSLPLYTTIYLSEPLMMQHHDHCFINHLLTPR